MRQKLSLSLAIALERPLTLLDEPFNGLDLEAQDRLAALLKGLCDGGRAVLLTGHQRDLAGVLDAKEVEIADGLLRPVATSSRADNRGARSRRARSRRARRAVTFGAARWAGPWGGAGVGWGGPAAGRPW